MGWNELTSIPAQIGNLTNLETLWVHVDFRAMSPWRVVPCVYAKTKIQKINPDSPSPDTVPQSSTWQQHKFDSYRNRKLDEPRDTVRISDPIIVLCKPNLWPLVSYMYKVQFGKTLISDIGHQIVLRYTHEGNSQTAWLPNFSRLWGTWHNLRIAVLLLTLHYDLGILSRESNTPKKLITGITVPMGPQSPQEFKQQQYNQDSRGYRELDQFKNIVSLTNIRFISHHIVLPINGVLFTTPN